jgi:hypothetical protein
MERTSINIDSKYGLFQKSFSMVFQMFTVWRVMRKCLHLKTYKLSIAEGVQRCIVQGV